MKRLRELDDRSPLIKRAQELISAAKPIDASPARGARIRGELDRPFTAKVAAFWTRVPALTVAGSVLLFGASSFAALRLWTAATQTEPPTAAPERDAADGSGAPPRADRRELETPSTMQPSATDISRPSAKPQPSAARMESRSNRVHRSSRRTTRARNETTAPVEQEAAAPAELETAAPPALSATPAEPEASTAEVPSPSRTTSPNSELVVRAVRALRRDADPALAARLLDEYRARRSAGPLGEEVLALQIEAAVANDDPRALRFAREYLKRYPAGRYADTARHALAEPSP